VQEVGTRGELGVVDWVGDLAVWLFVKDASFFGVAVPSEEEEHQGCCADDADDQAWHKAGGEIASREAAGGNWSRCGIRRADCSGWFIR